MKLSENEICKYSITCPYNNNTLNFCQGAQPNRNKIFNCNLVSDSGVFLEGKFRSSLDKSGEFKIIMENK